MGSRGRWGVYNSSQSRTSACGTKRARRVVCGCQASLRRVAASRVRPRAALRRPLPPRRRHGGSMGNALQPARALTPAPTHHAAAQGLFFLRPCHGRTRDAWRRAQGARLRAELELARRQQRATFQAVLRVGASRGRPFLIGQTYTVSATPFDRRPSPTNTRARSYARTMRMST
jgi:hypothetical protein